MKGKKVGRKRIKDKRISRTVSVYTTLHSFVCCNRDLLVSRLPPHPPPPIFVDLTPAQRPLPFPRGLCYFFMSYCNVSTAASPRRNAIPQLGRFELLCQSGETYVGHLWSHWNVAALNRLASKLKTLLNKVPHVCACSYELIPRSTSHAWGTS